AWSQGPRKIKNQAENGICIRNIRNETTASGTHPERIRNIPEHVDNVDTSTRRQRVPLGIINQIPWSGEGWEVLHTNTQN
ncbi:hypothetical protein EBZ38_10925, partial [bacterium]|nr:hypothetical protein [bacterium]